MTTQHFGESNLKKELLLQDTFFTWNAISTAPTNTLMADPSSAALPQGESAVYTAQVTITQDMMNTATEISNQVTITGSFTSPGGISGTTFDVSADNDNSDGKHRR